MFGNFILRLITQILEIDVTYKHENCIKVLSSTQMVVD